VGPRKRVIILPAVAPPGAARGRALVNAKLRYGIVGCGNISPIYLKASSKFDALQAVACADLDMDRARARAEEYGVRALSVDDLINDLEVDVVVNLTNPGAHYEVARRALEAGKHAYNEKPVSVRLDEGKALLALARQKGLRLGSAPDTFLGAGLQTSRKVIDDGLIGEPVAATAFMMSHGPEGWHPDPHFFFQPGAGPMFDMGPYYLTALVNLLGPIQRVSGSARASFRERIVGSGPKEGQRIPVNTPTHVAGLLEFAAGPIATIVTSFDVWSANVPRIEVYGSEGTLVVPDPNTFGGKVLVRTRSEKEFSEVPFQHPYDENSRGLGVADMAHAIAGDRQHRANGDLAVHVLETMHSILRASEERRHIDLETSCERPAALPVGANESVLV
jgi:predicted dehydrogenase